MHKLKKKEHIKHRKRAIKKKIFYGLKIFFLKNKKINKKAFFKHDAKINGFLKGFSSPLKAI